MMLRCMSPHVALSDVRSHRHDRFTSVADYGPATRLTQSGPRSPAGAAVQHKGSHQQDI